MSALAVRVAEPMSRSGAGEVGVPDSQRGHGETRHETPLERLDRTSRSSLASCTS